MGVSLVLLYILFLGCCVVFSRETWKPWTWMVTEPTVDCVVLGHGAKPYSSASHRVRSLCMWVSGQVSCSSSGSGHGARAARLLLLLEEEAAAERTRESVAQLIRAAWLERGCTTSTEPHVQTFHLTLYDEYCIKVTQELFRKASPHSRKYRVLVSCRWAPGSIFSAVFLSASPHHYIYTSQNEATRYEASSCCPEAVQRYTTEARTLYSSRKGMWQLTWLSW